MPKFVHNHRHIEIWSRLHALFILLATGWGLLIDSSLPLALMSGLSLIAFFISNRANWMPVNPWGGPANLITAGRWLGLVYIAIADLTAFSIGVGALIILIFDGLDGYLARKRGESSVFGEYLDKETDALYVLILSFLLVQSNLLGAWILGIGLMRYVYVLLLIWFKPADQPESRSKMGQVIAVILMAGLIGAFWLPEPWHQVPLIGGALLVSYSFGRSFWSLRRKSSKGKGSFVPE